MISAWHLLIWAVLALIIALIYERLPLVEPKERPDDIEETPLISVDSNEETRFQLVKLEYEKAAERYDNIYRAIWQNFSYMAALAAGILTFGSGKVPDLSLLVVLALTPLVFWWIANFLPMDHYGDATRTRLKAIEEDINTVYLSKSGTPKLGHFLLFRDTKYKWRARNIVSAVGILITAIWLFSGVVAADHGMRYLRRPPHDTVLERVTAARDSLLGVAQRLDSVNRMLQITVQCLSAPRPPNRARPPAC